MFDWLENVLTKIRKLNNTVEHYKEDSVIQSLPSVAYVNRAKKCLDNGQYKDALDILIEAESLPQEDALVYKYQGIIYDKLFRFEEAVKAYKKSANLNCHDKIIWKNLGFSLLSIKLYDEAEEAFENADKITPTNSEVLMGWGMVLMKQEKISEAREKFVLSCKYNRYNSNAFFLAAVMEIKLKMYDEAENKLQFLANVSPNEGNSYEFAKLKFIKKDLDGAELFAKKALDFNKNMLPCYLLLGKVRRMKNDIASLEYYKMAEELELISESLYLEWAVSLIKFEKYSEAIEKLNKVEELVTDSCDVKFLRAFCAISTGNIEENYKNEVQKLLAVDEQNYLALRALGVIACEEGDYKKAITLFKSALKSEPMEVVNNYYIAKAYLQSGDKSNAKEYFETSLKTNPNHLVSYLDYSKFLIQLEDYADANRKLRKALKLDENNVEILNMLFFVNYNLVKDSICEYNIKETLGFGEKIQTINEEAFEYPDKLAELAEMLKELRKKE